MTWAEMVKIEPRLEELYRDISSIVDDKSKPYFCANEIWYERFKPQFESIVGWDAANEEMQGSDAYDLAYDKLYTPLPSCRRCACL